MLIAIYRLWILLRHTCWWCSD